MRLPGVDSMSACGVRHRCVIPGRDLFIRSLENHNRNAPAGLALVVVKERPVIGRPGEPGIALGAGRDYGARTVRLAGQLDRDLGIGAEVDEPGGVNRRPDHWVPRYTASRPTKRLPSGRVMSPSTRVVVESL